MMEIDVEKLAEIITMLPDPNKYRLDKYKVITDDVSLNNREIIFYKQLFTNGDKKWVLELLPHIKLPYPLSSAHEMWQMAREMNHSEFVSYYNKLTKYMQS